MCHVLDYEQQHAELLETSPNYWARKLPEGLGIYDDLWRMGFQFQLASGELAHG